MSEYTKALKSQIGLIVGRERARCIDQACVFVFTVEKRALRCFFFFFFRSFALVVSRLPLHFSSFLLFFKFYFMNNMLFFLPSVFFFLMKIGGEGGENPMERKRKKERKRKGREGRGEE